jgi:multisubunit Na+/H+ antiporter MnhG subunit
MVRRLRRVSPKAQVLKLRRACRFSLKGTLHPGSACCHLLLPHHRRLVHALTRLTRACHHRCALRHRAAACSHGSLLHCSGTKALLELKRAHAATRLGLGQSLGLHVGARPERVEDAAALDVANALLAFNVLLVSPFAALSIGAAFHLVPLVAVQPSLVLVRVARSINRHN